jgi:hypothetical protein
VPPTCAVEGLQTLCQVQLVVHIDSCPASTGLLGREVQPAVDRGLGGFSSDAHEGAVRTSWSQTLVAPLSTMNSSRAFTSNIRTSGISPSVSPARVRSILPLRVNILIWPLRAPKANG